MTRKLLSVALLLSMTAAAQAQHEKTVSVLVTWDASVFAGYTPANFTIRVGALSTFIHSRESTISCYTDDPVEGWEGFTLKIKPTNSWAGFADVNSFFIYTNEPGEDPVRYKVDASIEWDSLVLDHEDTVSHVSIDSWTITYDPE